MQDIRSFGEYNPTDALDCMIKRGAKFKSFKVKNWLTAGKRNPAREQCNAFKKYGGKVHESVQSENSIIVPQLASVLVVF